MSTAPMAKSKTVAEMCFSSAIRPQKSMSSAPQGSRPPLKVWISFLWRQSSHDMHKMMASFATSEGWKPKSQRFAPFLTVPSGVSTSTSAVMENTKAGKTDICSSLGVRNLAVSSMTTVPTTAHSSCGRIK